MTIGLSTAVIAAAVYWMLVLVRIERALRRMTPLRDGLDWQPPASDAPLVSVIVPAHNEAADIDQCLTSLRGQDYPNFEIIVVLDRCTDDTAAIVDRHARADDRLTYIENEHCPEGWAGKCNAVRIGVERAQGEWLLFTDADTRAAPPLIRTALAQAMRRGVDLLSLLSDLNYERAFECIAQPVATMNLIRMFPIDRANRAERPRPFANGQFMLTRREPYEALGGHATVREAIMEDIKLAREIHKHGGRVEVMRAEGLLHCTMYDSYEEFRRGWQRIFTGSSNFSPGRLTRYGFRVLGGGLGVFTVQAGALIAGAWLIATGPAWVGGAMIALVLVSLAMQWLALGRMYRLGGAPLWAVLFYPAGCWIVGTIFLTAGRNLRRQEAIVWGGRDYVFASRSG